VRPDGERCGMPSAGQGALLAAIGVPGGIPTTFPESFVDEEVVVEVRKDPLVSENAQGYLSALVPVKSAEGAVDVPRATGLDR